MAQSPQLKQSSPTSPDPQDFRLDATPAMRADNVVSGEHWRIGLITDSLVRFEWSDSGVFENRPTQTVLNRDFGSPVERRVTERDGRVIIDTAALTIVYDQQPFSKEGLSVVVKGVADTQFNTWHYGDAPRGNLKGTARTLDEADGAIELDNGVISRDGWAVIDDSAANIIIETDTVNGKANPFGTWVSPRATAETDLYFFGYGHRYIEAVRDFYRLTGPACPLPRSAWATGGSRYYRYTQDGYLALMDRFKREGIPFTTSVIDMDWHRVDDVDPKYGSGWTGYSWNRELFPDPPAFLADLHRRGLRTTLNVHPRDGVRAFEDAYPEVAKRVGIDPATEENVEFDLTNPDFVDAYFDMHHRMEAEGVDFWWLDWQAGGGGPRPPAGRRDPPEGSRPAVDAQPHALPRLRARRQLAAHLLPVRRPRLPPLPGRLLRRHDRDLGIARLPAAVHRHRFQHRVWLGGVTPPDVRLPQRRAGGPLVPARRVQPDQPTAFVQLAVLRQGAVELQP